MNTLAAAVSTGAASAAALATTPLGQGELLGWAAGLAAVALLSGLAEIFIVSGGLLLVLSGALAVASIIVAFQAGSLAGTVFLVVLPLLGLALLRFGLRVLSRSRAVAQGVISDDAGYRHAAEHAGVAVGAIGRLVTAARPTGRARFAGGELDVQVHGPPLDAGASVRVTLIDGPVITVVPER